MPRISVKALPVSIDTEELLTDLTNELREPSERGQPLILDEELSPGGSVRVYVVWDRFAEIPGKQRTELILDAFEESEGIDFRQRISMALGLTVPEATDIGLLPFV